jgi:hypothetical protein
MGTKYLKFQHAKRKYQRISRRYLSTGTDLFQQIGAVFVILPFFDLPDVPQHQAGSLSTITT